MKNRITVKKCVAALLGIFFVGAGVAFNAGSGLGNDPVGIFYDGIRVLCGLEGAQLGMASNIVNGAITLALVFIGRRYVNVGTLIYILPYGFFVSLGNRIYEFLLSGDGMVTRTIGVVSGSLMICIGVAIFIVADIGLDPLTGLTMVMGDKLKIPYRKAKVLFDLILTVTGFLMGGKLGVVTVVLMLLVGPVIQIFVDSIRKGLKIFKVGVLAPRLKA